MSLVRQLERAERMHRFIKFKRTGSPEEFAEKMNLSLSMLYVVIKEMKQLGAPIGYCRFRQSYVYTKEVELRAGFFPQYEMLNVDVRAVQGGAKVISLYRFICA